MRVLVVASALALWSFGAAAGPVGQVRVIDGDTVEIAGTRVRLFGIDAHELDQSCTGSDGRNIRCGLWARDEAAALFDGRRAACETLKYDAFGRSLAICRIKGTDMAETMLRAGIVDIYPKETLRDYPEFAKEAELLGRGIWAWSFERPFDHRANLRDARAAPSADAPGDGCKIKGNISGGGRIYHRPGQENYERTRINTAKGERWFCSADEAERAGWRAARR
ncbi:MAG: thermonuclease family protein [Pseudomonadota bacterium]